MVNKEHQQRSNREKMIGVYQFDFKTNKYIGSHVSIRQAERDTGVKGSDISACCKGNIRQAGGFIWIRKEDYV